MDPTLAKETSALPSASETKQASSVPALEKRLRVMLFGLALGDALGAPWEFERLPWPTGGCFIPLKNAFPGRPEVGTTLPPPRWGPYRNYGPFFGRPGQVTDDTEMTIALADALASKRSWDREAVIQSYVGWANSGGRFIGRNTKALFGKIKTGDAARANRTYQKRWKQTFSGSLENWTQSNGCLMRASPLAVCADPAAAVADCALTNPHPVCLAACRFYHSWLRNVLKSGGAFSVLEAARAALAELEASPFAGLSDELLEMQGRSAKRSEEKGNIEVYSRAGRAQNKAAVELVAESVRQALRGLVVNGEKGWILTSLSRAVAMFVGRASLGQSGETGLVDVLEVVQDCVRLGGDTDTNAAIVGAVAGAAAGEFASPFLDVMLACDTIGGDLERPPAYRAARLSALAVNLAALWQP